MPSTCEILNISGAPDLIDQVIDLGDSNRSTLGFMPRAAFTKFAALDLIKVAMSKNRTILGYILYRPTKNRYSITHCCVANEGRGQGVGKQLIDSLVAEAKKHQIDSVFLKCRQDYGIDDFWTTCSFSISHTTRGRSKRGDLLNIWVLALRDSELFSWSSRDEKTSSTSLEVMFDLNVLLDLYGRNDFNDESNGLVADWLKDDIKLVGSEILIQEISKSASTQERLDQVEFTKKFRLKVANETEIETVRNRLSQIWPIALDRNNNRFDFEHVCNAIACDVDVFVTRDEELLDACEAINTELNIRVCRPGELITEVHTGKVPSTYKPKKLEGLTLYEETIPPRKIELIARTLTGTIQGERKRALIAIMRSLAAYPAVNQLLSIRSNDEVFASYSYTKKTEHLVLINLLRVKKGDLIQLLCEKCLRHAAGRFSNGETSTIVKVTDRTGALYYKDNLENLGFYFLKSGKAVRLIINKVITLEQLRADISDERFYLHFEMTSEEVIELRAALILKMSEPTLNDIADLETVLSPLKIKNSGLPCYIVPIKPNWARMLFDEQLAASDLLEPDLGTYCNFENVYYHRSPVQPKYPSRILWYVSLGDGTNRHLTSQIRHTSLIRSVSSGTPKSLFKKNQNLGVYSWRDISASVEANLDKNLKLFRFNNTHSLKKQCSREHFTNLNIRGEFVTIRPLTEEKFFEILQIAHNERD